MLSWLGERRFPRPRGDGPLMDSPSAHFATVSPPTRGWTRAMEPDYPGGVGFPAHAGMDLDDVHDEV